MTSHVAPHPAVGESEDDDRARRFVEVFAAGWACPTDADAFADHFIPWLDPEYHGTVPLLRLGKGPTVFREDFVRPLLDVLRQVRGTVTDWASAGDTVYIELRIDCLVGRSPVAIRVCDRFRLRDGKAVSRVTYLDDPTPLVRAVVRHPSVWPRVGRFLLHALGPARRRAREWSIEKGS